MNTKKITQSEHLSRRNILQSSALAATIGISLSACHTSTPTAADSSLVTNSTTTLEELVGQHIIYSYAGLTPPQALLEHIHQGRVGGIIFFADNIASCKQLAAVTKQLNDTALKGKSKKRLLLTTDQEGGYVSRIPQEALSEKAIGTSANPLQSVRILAQQHAQLLAYCGLNTNLSPVADVYRNEHNFIDQYGRSFSSDPHQVANLVTEYILILQKHNIHATAKHFPGIGNAPAGGNTDEKSITLNIDIAGLQSVDLVPFHAAIAAHVSLIMTSWAIYPTIDPHQPAGLSRKIVTNLLRSKLGYQGVIITDALEAGAIRAQGTLEERAAKAIAAGNDLICCSNRNIEQGDRATAGICAALRSGKLSKDEFLISTSRLANLTR